MIKPFASDKNFLRTDLRGGITKSLDLNIKNLPLLDCDAVKIFEIGNVFTKDEEYTSLAIGWSEKDSDIVKKLSEFFGVEVVGETKDNIFETNFDELLKKLPEPEGEYEKLEKKENVTYKSISPYPFMLRDVAVWVPADKTSDDVLEIVKKEAGDLLVNTKLFDEFKKDDKVSYAFNLVFQSQDKTLSDEEINKIMTKITDSLNSSSNWEVR
jgi:phenylalanyl-tRNA synthetase beta subunit